jgi:hypothetical protein
MAETLAENHHSFLNGLPPCSSEDSRARLHPLSREEALSAVDLSVDALVEPGHLTHPLASR